MSHDISTNPKHCKVFLLGTSALVCLALGAPVMAEDFTIALGTTTNDGETINGGDTVTVTGALTTTGANKGIETANVVGVDDGNTITVLETGSITTGTGQFAYGIDTAGDGNTITLSGSIKTTANDGYGINNRGDDNETIVSGSITTGVVGTTGGVDSAGIWNRAANNTTTLTSTGVITVNGSKADGIYNSNGKNITIVHGSIFVNGNGVDDDGAEGITNYGDDNKTTLFGSITTTGDYSGGIVNDGASNETTVSGRITTTGDDGYGIYNYGTFNETTVSGRITTTGDDGYGIYNYGTFNNTTVSGSITTGVFGTNAGEDSTGIWNSGNDNTTTLTSTGVITVNGSKADAIYNHGYENITIVHGSIFVNGNGVSTSEGKSSGIFNHDDNKTTLSGSITTTGDYSGGIYNYGDNNETTVTGRITTDGTEAYGIVNSGDCGTDCNTNTNMTSISGTVKSTGTRSAALYNKSGSGNSFTLNEGATIIGDILARGYDVDVVASTNSKLIFNLGASTSYAYSVSGMGAGTDAGQWKFSDLDGRTQGITTDGTGCDETISDAGNTVCNLVTAVGNGNAEAQDELQYSMNSSMIGSLSLGSNTAAPVEVMSFAQTSQSNVWANLYGGSSKRDVSTTQSSFDSSNRGLTIGTPVAVNDTLNVDLVFNTSNTKLDIGSTKDQEITAKSYNVGAILRDLAPSTGWGVDAYGFVGRNSYDGKRKVMNNQEATGSETVTASYSGMEVLVGVDAQYSQAINETLNFIGGVNASLSNEKIGAYSESNYYSWNARTLTQVAGGVTAGLEYHNDAFTSFATIGLQRSSLQRGQTAGYTNNGTAGSYTDTSGAATYRSATVGFNYAADDSMNITGTAGMSRASGGISGSSVSLSANWTF